MNSTFAAVFLLVGNALLILWLVIRPYFAAKKELDAYPDEHTHCDCVGCGNSCCECVPIQNDAICISNSVADIINALRGTNKALIDVISKFGYKNLQDLSTAQLLTIDDKLYRCNVCGYWSDHVNASTSKYAALWLCPHCQA